MRVAGIPVIINGELLEANTEYEVVLPSNYKKVMLQARQNVPVKFAYVQGKSGTEYITVKSGSTYFDDGIRTNSKIYLQSPSAGTIVEILVWHGGDDAS